MTAHAILRWQVVHGVKWHIRAPGKPQQTVVESLSGGLCDEGLNEALFGYLPAVRTLTEAWQVDYDTYRPHTSLGGLIPNTVAARS